MLRRFAGVAASQGWIRNSPPVRRVWLRFVAGEDADDAIRAGRALTDSGLLASLNHVGRDPAAPGNAAGEVLESERLVDLIATAGLAGTCEVSIKLTSLGLYDPADDARDRTRERIHSLCRTATDHGVLITLDAERHEDLPFLVATTQELRRDFPSVGVAIPANHVQAESFCQELATAGSRVRLVKGDFGPRARTRAQRHGVDGAYVRCLARLMRGPGHPMVATHDPRLVRIALNLVELSGRDPSTYEFQMLYGLRRPEQARLAALGHHVRGYVPYGDGTFEWMMYLLASKPSSPALLARALLHDS